MRVNSLCRVETSYVQNCHSVGFKLKTANVVDRNAKNVSLLAASQAVTPGLSDWIQLMTETASYEYMIARRNGVKGKFHLIWDYFYLYIKGLVPGLYAL